MKKAIIVSSLLIFIAMILPAQEVAPTPTAWSVWTVTTNITDSVSFQDDKTAKIKTVESGHVVSNLVVYVAVDGITNSIVMKTIKVEKIDSTKTK